MSQSQSTNVTGANFYFLFFRYVFDKHRPITDRLPISCHERFTDICRRNTKAQILSLKKVQAVQYVILSCITFATLDLSSFLKTLLHMNTDCATAEI
jgi:hypothetical protein